MFFYCMVVFLILCASNALEDPTVTTKLGSIKGYHKKSYNGRTYSAFEGIPYAKPPVDDLRFEPPVESDPWTETLIANNSYECPQNALIFVGQEDCLYINVYVPREAPSSSDNFDVVVHIHGGAFVAGKSTMFGPHFIIDKDVVFVNFNYRLGVLGFLSTEDDVVPGNNGMKDQVLALRWIQNHIKNFGGNPNSVTITGASAGGASVHLHYFSKMSKGLFHRGISQSGTALAPWVFRRRGLDTAKALGVKIGCSSTTSSDLRNCLKTKSAEDLINNAIGLNSPVDAFPLTVFAPVIEKKSNSAFLDSYPLELLLNKDFHDLPWISSICTDEGALSILNLYNDLDNLDSKFNQFAQYYLDYNYTTCDSDKEAVALALRKHYFETEEIGKKTYKNIMKMFSDGMFGLSLEKSARIQASVASSKVYSYIFGYKNSFSDDFNKLLGVKDLDLGVGHAEDAQLLYDTIFFGDQIVNGVLSKEDELVKNMMVDMFVSFARGGAPEINDVTLLPVSNSTEFVYLSIKSPTDVKINITNEISPTEFWNSLPITDDKEFSPELCKVE